LPSAQSTTRFLLEALRHGQTPGAWLSLSPREEIDWDDLAVRAIVLGLAPQLHYRLRAWDVEVPAQAAAKLSVTYEAQKRRSRAIYAQLDEILAACAACDVRPVALKGVHLAACRYPEPALRPMNDVDLLFAEREMPQVKTILTELGYEERYKSPELGAGVTKHTSTFRRGSGQEPQTPNPYLSAAGDRTIEPHTSLQESWYGLVVDVTHGVRARSRTVQLGRQPARVLASEDLLLHLCVHCTFHFIMGVPLLVQLGDLLLVCRDEGLDWDIFVQRAGANEAMPYALAALTLAQRLLAAPVPPGVLSALAQGTPTRLRRYIETLDLKAVMERTQQEPWNSTWQRIVHGLRARAETARWAPDRRSRWRVWRTVLHVMRSDTGRMLLQKLN
jgi:hypothetical protein